MNRIITENNNPRYSRSIHYSNNNKTGTSSGGIPVVPPRRNKTINLHKSLSNVYITRNKLDQPSTSQSNINKPHFLDCPVPALRKNIRAPSKYPRESIMEHPNAPQPHPRPIIRNVCSVPHRYYIEDDLHLSTSSEREGESSEDLDFDNNVSFGFRSSCPPKIPPKPLSAIARVRDESQEENAFYKDDMDGSGVFFREITKEYVAISRGNVRDNMVIMNTMDKDNNMFTSFPNIFTMSLFQKYKDGDKLRVLYIVEELKESEKSYVQRLIEFVYEFIPELEKLCFLNVRKDNICTAINNLCHKSESFLDDLEMCNDEEDVANTFINHQELFQFYPKYISLLDSPPSYVKQYENILLFKHDHTRLYNFKNILLAPLQRLAMYRLFLQNIFIEVKNAHSVTAIPRALRLIEEQLKQSKNISLGTFEVPERLLQNGKILQANTFRMTKPDKGDVSVLLFEEAIVLLTLNPKSSDNSFEYFQDIKMQYLEIRKSLRRNILILEDISTHITYEIDTLSEENFRIWMHAVQEQSLIKRQKEVREEVPTISKPYDLRDHKVNVAREIKDCPFDVSVYGKLILMNTFLINNKKVTMFLYEGIIIITTVPEEDNLNYFYQRSILMCNINLEPENKKKPKVLLIKDHFSSKRHNKNIIHKLTGETVENVNSWRTEINNCLWKQFVEKKNINLIDVHTE